MTLLHPEMLALSPLAILAWFLLRLAEKRQAAWRAAWRTPSHPSQILRPLTAAGGVLLIILALARPVWNPEPVNADTPGQDTVFLIDVSNSMLTADLDQGQNRIGAVKLALTDLMPELKGDRAALVAFAGTTVVKCPLTTDLAYFSAALSLIEPGATARGGTMLGDALRQVKRDFVRPGHKLAIWIFTDGGDQDSFALEAVRDLAGSGTRLFIWGVGSLAGGPVPGKNISSVLNEELLKGLASALPDSAYWGAESPLWQLNQAYAAHRAPDSTLATTQVVWQEGSWWLLWPILLLTLLASPVRLAGLPDWLRRIRHRGTLARPDGHIHPERPAPVRGAAPPAKGESL